MKNENHKVRLQSLTDSLVKQSAEPPVQMVVTVPLKQIEEPTAKNESQLNVEIETEIIDRLKFRAVKTRRKLKHLVAEALIEYLDKVENAS